MRMGFRGLFGGLLTRWPAGCRRYPVSRFALIVGIALAAGAPAANAQRLQMPAHEKVVLKNGLTVLLLENIACRW